jgi:hypothetical protein
MRPMTGILTTIDTTSPTTHSTSWWKLLLQGLKTWITSLRESQASLYRDMPNPYPRQETPIDVLAQKHTFLYAYSLMG